VTLRRKVGEMFRGGETLVGTSPTMVETFKTIGRVAQSEAAVLIRGESGTGKELVARAIHYHSRRRDGPFIAVNMSAIPSELMETELFGHERGAFTGATESRVGRFRDAEGGTILLDEIGDLSLPLQAKLLRVLQEREVTPVGGRRPVPIDVRIVAATHKDLERSIEESEFREDLYFRLNVVPIRIPPLRARTEDVPALVQHFVERFSNEIGVPQRWPTASALDVLRSHDWPGNVRELENVIKRALVLASGDVITADDVQIATETTRTGAADWPSLARGEFAEWLDTSPPMADDEDKGPYWIFVERLERAVIAEAMTRSGGNQIQAARLLGINRNTLRKKLADLNIGLPSGSSASS